jgi:hypothetical protein
MSLFHVLRSSHWLARSALLWFALTLGAAVAMPAAHSQTEVVICTGIGMQKVLINADGTVTTSADAGISCALCLVGGAVPTSALPLLAWVQVRAQVSQGVQVAYRTVTTAVPPPARGPPRV